VEEELRGISAPILRTKNWRPERNFRGALEKAEIAYLLSFDPEYLDRQQTWQKARFVGLVDLSHPVVVWEPVRRRTVKRGYAIESISSNGPGKIRFAELPTVAWGLNTSETAVL
jgi:hypothetical protein